MATNLKSVKGSELSRLIGRNVKAARMRAGLTQSQLAEALKLDNVTVSRLETGVQVPSIDRLDDVATALGTSLAQLTTDHNDTDAFGGLFAEVVKDLPAREKEFVFAMAVQYAQHWRAGKKRRAE
jgi:transcriptional regulator with XRE-family HTH domain